MLCNPDGVSSMPVVSTVVAPVIGSNEAPLPVVYNMPLTGEPTPTVTFNWLLPLVQIELGVAVVLRIEGGLELTVMVTLAVPVHPPGPVAVTV